MSNYRDCFQGQILLNLIQRKIMISQNFIQGKAFPFFFFLFFFFPGPIWSRALCIVNHMKSIVMLVVWGKKKKKQIQPLLEGRDEER